MDARTEIEPPGLQPEEDGDDGPSVYVAVNVIEDDGTYRNSNVTVQGEATDEQLADALIASLRGVATNRGPGLAAAVERRLR